MARKVAIHATLAEKFEIKRLIELHSKPTGQIDTDGRQFRAWDEGWSHEKAAQTVRKDLKDSHSIGISKEFGWKFADSVLASRKTVDGALTRIDEAVAKVEAVLGRIDDMEANILKLLESEMDTAKQLTEAARVLSQVESDVRVLKIGQNHLEKGHREMLKEVRDGQKGKTGTNSNSVRG